MIRKRPQKSASLDKINDIRILEWIPLAPPDYIIDQDYLIDRFIEREIIYHGTLNNISSEIEMKKRNDIVRIIDNGFKSQQINQTDTSHIISISAQNIKFNKRYSPEALVLRIPIEQIKTIAYIKDNSSHYIAILHGILPDKTSFKTINLTVASTETRIKAEEICSLISQCFQIIYTEATIRYFDRNIISTDTMSDDLKKIHKNEMKYTDKKSNMKPEKNISLCEFDSVNSEISASKAECIQSFVLKLTTILNKDEMKRFAEILSAWQQGGPFETFCRQMQQLLGSNRIYILENMRNFIDPPDWFTLQQFFNEFSPQSKSCSPLGNWSQLIAKSPLPTFQTQRSLSYASTSNGVLSINDEENSVGDDISSPIKNTHYNKRLSESKDNTEFSKAIDNLFNQVGDLELILSSDK